MHWSRGPSPTPTIRPNSRPQLPLPTTKGLMKGGNGGSVPPTGRLSCYMYLSVCSQRGTLARSQSQTGRGTPILPDVGGLPSSFQLEVPKTGWGYPPPCEDCMRVPLPIVRTWMMVIPPPNQDWMGVHPPREWMATWTGYASGGTCTKKWFQVELFKSLPKLIKKD